MQERVLIADFGFGHDEGGGAFAIVGRESLGRVLTCVQGLVVAMQIYFDGRKETEGKKGICSDYESRAWRGFDADRVRISQSDYLGNVTGGVSIGGWGWSDEYTIYSLCSQRGLVSRKMSKVWKK
jgi:hypothetical protein